MKCNWCGAGASATDKTCTRCGAPLSITVKNVMIDFSGVEEQIQMSAAMTPFMTEKIMPSRCFEIEFDGDTATMTYRKPTSGGGAVAQGRNAVAVGAGGVYVGGNVVGGSITIGNNNTVNTSSKAPKPVVLSLWLPAGINYIVISGNGKSSCQCEVDYQGARVVPQNATVS